MLFSEYSKYFKNTFSEEHLQTTASGSRFIVIHNKSRARPFHSLKLSSRLKDLSLIIDVFKDSRYARVFLFLTLNKCWSTNSGSVFWVLRIWFSLPWGRCCYSILVKKEKWTFKHPLKSARKSFWRQWPLLIFHL